MQQCSNNYKKSMKNMLRNRGYIRIYIGVVNSQAQKNANVSDEKNQFTYFSDVRGPFNSEAVEYIYATGEQNFSRVDGNFYFLPRSDKNIAFRQGLVTEELLGTIYVFFAQQELDIKGLTIDFGGNYPVDFTIDNGHEIYNYTDNGKAVWSTEDVFYNTTYFKITPQKMCKGQGRLRIYQFMCGIANSFTNGEILKYSFKDFVSPITETIPSQDMSITVDNHKLYYSADNPDSTLAFLEPGQEVKAAFGYDVDGMGKIEWIAENTVYLKSWTADDKQAKFTATDRFDYLSGTYYKGRYRPEGISLYDLALDVIQDAGIIDEKEYFIDPYLKNIYVYNPVPVVKHTEALQMIANAGRCVLTYDRKCRIHMQGSFIPDMLASSDDQTVFSQVQNILNNDTKNAYAMESKNFSIVDGSIYFISNNGEFLQTGYVSESIANKTGNFETNPVITLKLEAAMTAFGVRISFRNVAPDEFEIRTYYQNVPVTVITIDEPEVEFVSHEEFPLFDKMEFIFTKGKPYSRITVDSIEIGDITDYTLEYGADLIDSPTGLRQNKVKSIDVLRKTYHNSVESRKDLCTEEIVVSPESDTYTVYFTNASYGFSAEVLENPLITCDIEDYSNYFATIKFNGVIDKTSVTCKVSGYEYKVEENYYSVKHNHQGEIKVWKNPLISTWQQAADLERWLASYYLGDIEYSLKMRGDPRIDANDFFFLELKERENPMICGYQNEIRFNGAWEATMKARKVVTEVGKK